MSENKKIVVYGGSFNPPHNFHFAVAQQVINELEDVEKVIFVPVNKEYVKENLAENHHRYHMLDAVIQDNPNFLLSDMDMKEPQSLTTIETLERMQEQFPNNEICFLLGSDNLKEIHQWDRADELLSNYKMIVVERANDNVNQMVEGSDFLKKNRENLIILHMVLKSNCSATFLRNQIQQQKSIQYLVPDTVYQYIQEHHLYEEG